MIEKWVEEREKGLRSSNKQASLLLIEDLKNPDYEGSEQVLQEILAERNAKIKQKWGEGNG